jgi:lipoate-protein ligase A
MAVDQALLTLANVQAQVTLRLYRWSEPTLSIGYFQPSADRQQHAASLPCALVRRASGGGAILHDNELTYSLCIPSASRWSKENRLLYTIVHEGIIQSLARRGIQAMLYDGVDNPSGTEPKAFLCFQRRSHGDVVLENFKIAGSAQRRLKNAVLQHGSILIGKSKFAPELPGIDDLCGFQTNCDLLSDELAEFVCCRLNLEADVSTLQPRESESARNIESARFASDIWNFNR